MLQRSDITVCIPSRGRAKKAVANRARFFPTGLVYVAETEKQDYLDAGIPEKFLRTHPDLVGFAKIRNFMMQDCPTKVGVQIDDDLEGVIARPGRRMRLITDATQLAEIM